MGPSVLYRRAHLRLHGHLTAQPCARLLSHVREHSGALRHVVALTL